jgi:membrane protease YdiL (CAAX protease family)
MMFWVYRPWAKLVATASFLYLPLWFGRKRDEDARDYGLTLRRWREDLKLFLAVAIVLVPTFLVAFWGFALLLPHLPHGLVHTVTPLTGQLQIAPRLPRNFHVWVVDQLFVVALPEEFFYRGFIQTRLRDAWPEGRMFVGARLGRAFFLTAILFAVGHLAVFQVWRLAVFFPALLFGWMRERTGTVLGAGLLHGFCNLLEMVLEASFFNT